MTERAITLELSEREVRALRRAAAFLLYVCGDEALDALAHEHTNERVFAIESAAMKLDLALLTERCEP